MGILQLGTVRLSVDGSKFKANASKLKNRVHKIVDEADKTDAKENTEQGKANDYINHPAEDSEQDSPESQANKIKKPIRLFATRKLVPRTQKRKPTRRSKAPRRRPRYYALNKALSKALTKALSKTVIKKINSLLLREKTEHLNQRTKAHQPEINRRNRRNKKLRSKTKLMPIAA